MNRIGDSVYQLCELDGGPTLLVGGDELTLVDTGNAGDAEAIIDAIHSLGRDPAELRRILITHADPDHIGSLAALARMTTARIYAEKHEAAVIEGRAPYRSGGFNPEPTPVDSVLRAGQVLPIHGGIAVVDASGHTVGHVAYLLLDGRVLLVGDSLNNNGALTGSRPGFTYDDLSARQTVRALAELCPTTICFGHGPPIIGDASARLKALAKTL